MKLVNFHVRHPSTPAVEAVLKSVLKGPAVLTDECKGWISFYDAEADQQNPAELHRIAGAVSAGLSGPVWAFLVSDKVWSYLIYEHGELQDEFLSKPDHFGSVSESRRTRLAGDPDVVRRSAKPGTTADAVRRVLAGGPIGADTDAFKERLRKNIQGTSPESVGQMLGMAAEHMNMVSPEMIKGILANAGIPADNPLLAPFLKDPAAFLKQMASNPETLKLMTRQVTAMSEAAIDNTPEAPTEMRLLELGGNLLGIEPVRLGLSQGSFARKEVPEAPWFRPL